MTAGDFHGAKLFLICEDELLVYRRDNKPDIPFPNRLDLPGGGRENGETPEECVLRELVEEFDLRLQSDRLIWRKQYENWRKDGSQSFFFAANISNEEIDTITFGDEGQHWMMMPVQEYLESPDSIEQHCERLRDYLVGA